MSCKNNLPNYLPTSPSLSGTNNKIGPAGRPTLYCTTVKYIMCLFICMYLWNDCLSVCVFLSLHWFAIIWYEAAVSVTSTVYHFTVWCGGKKEVVFIVWPWDPGSHGHTVMVTLAMNKTNTTLLHVSALLPTTVNWIAYTCNIAFALSYPRRDSTRLIPSPHFCFYIHPHTRIHS